MGEDTENAHQGESTAVLAPKVEVSDVGPWKKMLRIEVSAEGVKAEYEDALKELARSAQVPGFRKGRVPRVRLLKQFAKSLAEEVKAKLVGKAGEEALKAHDLEAVSTSELDIKELQLDLEKPFSFEITVEVKPTFELPAYKGLKLTRHKVPVTEERIDRFIDTLRRDRANYVAVEQGGAEPGDRLTVSARLEVDGAEVWTTENDVAHLLDDYLLGISIPAPRAEVEGMKAGDEKRIEVTVPQSFKDEALRGKAGSLSLKVEEVKRPQLPALDEEAAKKLGAESVEDLRGRVAARLERQAASEEEEDLQHQVVEKLLEGAQFELPEGLLARETRAREMRQMIRMAQMGIRADSLEERQRQELRDGAKASSDRGLRAGLVFAKIAETEGITVTDEEVEEEVYKLAAAYRQTPVTVRSRLEREGRLEGLRDSLATTKVVNFLMEQADITDAAEGPPAASGGDASEGGAQ